MDELMKQFTNSSDPKNETKVSTPKVAESLVAIPKTAEVTEVKSKTMEDIFGASSKKVTPAVIPTIETPKPVEIPKVTNIPKAVEIPRSEPIVPKVVSTNPFGPSVKKEEKVYDFSQETEVDPREIYTIYGDKGDGKTTLAFSMKGLKACLSFDKKSMMIKKYMYNNDKDIMVYDCVKMLDQSSQQKYLDSAKDCFDYILQLLEHLKNVEKPDWIVIDGVEIMQNICEMVMRKNNNIMPYEGFANKNIWKERRIYVNQIHNKAIDASKNGVIYTTYTEFKDIAIENGDVKKRKEIPKWIENIMFSTDTVIRVDTTDTKDGRRFIALIESSKTGLKTNAVYDITGKGFEIILNDRKDISKKVSE